MGESAGASSIMHHITSNGGKTVPIYKRAILQSTAFFPQYISGISTWILTIDITQSRLSRSIQVLQPLLDVPLPHWPAFVNSAAKYYKKLMRLKHVRLRMGISNMARPWMESISRIYPVRNYWTEDFQRELISCLDITGNSFSLT